MDTAEIIENNQRFDIFEQLQQDRTLLKMNVLGRNFEHLTMITGTRRKKNRPCFFIDYPDGFREATANENHCSIRFEFVGSDHVKYRFKTTGSRIERNQVCIEFPPAIHRLQRRNDFRVSPPLGTRLCFKAEGKRYEMSALNLSRSGTLVTMDKKQFDTQKTPNLPVGDRLKDLVLNFPAKTEIGDVQVKSAQVIRVGKNPVTGQNTCAFHFDDIQADQEKRLIRLLYRFQRDLLQKKIS